MSFATGNDTFDLDELADRIERLTGWRGRRPPQVLTDTTDSMDLTRGHILHLGDRLYAVMGCTYESRFGISDQPKYWVLRGVDLDSGEDKIIKTVFHEEFTAHVGPLRIRCYRDQTKEGDVLRLVRGDGRFMQGFTVFDSAGNDVRILDFIRGPSLFNHVFTWDEEHESYAAGEMQNLLHRLIESIEGIQLLHDNGFCHGDIRNDHIIIERETDRFRWIDFDLKQDFSDFDIWSIGNILAYIVGLGIRSFHQVKRSDQVSDEIKNSLEPGDACTFYDYRIMNMRKLYPYLSRNLNDVLMRFSASTTTYYERIDQVAEDLGNALDTM